jgi:hypothetical protein
MKRKDLFPQESNPDSTATRGWPSGNGKTGGGEEEGQERMLDERNLQITRWIQAMDDLEPPPQLIGSVMQRLRPKGLPWWLRLYRWAVSPKSITFIPLRWAAVAIILVGIFITTSLLLKQRDFQNIQTPSLFAVTFRLKLPEAHSVSVIGTFNAWRTEGYAMRLNEDQKTWSLEVWLPPGRYEYAYLVDSQKVITDPGALFFQSDGFGNQNSVLILGRSNGENI